MKNGDRYTLRKLLSIFTGSIVKLKELTEPLDQNADADRKLASRRHATSAKRWPRWRRGSESS